MIKKNLQHRQPLRSLSLSFTHARARTHTRTLKEAAKRAQQLKKKTAPLRAQQTRCRCSSWIYISRCFLHPALAGFNPRTGGFFLDTTSAFHPRLILPQGWPQRTESSVWTPAFYLLARSHADSFHPQHASSLVSPAFFSSNPLPPTCLPFNPSVLPCQKTPSKHGGLLRQPLCPP